MTSLNTETNAALSDHSILLASEGQCKLFAVMGLDSSKSVFVWARLPQIAVIYATTVYLPSNGTILNILFAQRYCLYLCNMNEHAP
jgi:hypothetical protein